MVAGPDGRQLAFHQRAGDGPGLVFLGGFNSDMTGTKAVFLDDWAARTGRAFLRFDYSGHGASSGAFEEGAIGDWADDAAAVITARTTGPQILVGSSMGGWIALLLARRMPERVAGLIGIAAAPDFTEDGVWAGLSEAERAELMATGRFAVPSPSDPEPTVFTRRLIEDGRHHLVLRTPLRLGMPVRLLHGTDDDQVRQSVPLALLAHADAPDLTLTLIKGGDHRLSTPLALDHLRRAIAEIDAARTPEPKTDARTG